VKKCHFLESKLKILGHMVNKERLAQNTEKRQSEKWRNRRNCSRNRVDKIIGALNYEEKIQPGKEKQMWFMHAA